MTFSDQLRLLFFRLFTISWYAQVHSELKRLTAHLPHPLKVLDIGGRYSPYTLGINARVTVSELPRESEIQKSLNLGVTDEIVRYLKERRSNVEDVLLDDMTHTQIPEASYDIAVAVEVLEHVEEDHLFIENVYRVLKPGGYFIMTTPNGRVVPNKNPDHKRHYTQEHLSKLLLSRFDEVDVKFSTRRGIILYIALRSPRRWWYAAPLIYICRLINNIQSSSKSLEADEYHTEKLFATARKL